MIGLLIVSHSAKIAEGVKELAQQMARQVPIAAAGGTSEGALGTSADLIRAAADQLVADGATDGVLVLLDMGSAVMSAEIALDGFGTPFHLSNAPLVEGALIAAVEASVASDLRQIASAADQTRQLRKVQE